MKIYTHRGEFGSIKIKEEENIPIFFVHVDKIVNIIEGMGEMFDEKMIV